MAITSSYEQTKESRASVATDGNKYTRRFLVTVDDETDGAAVAVDLAGAWTPNRGDAHPVDPNAAMVRKTPRMHGDRMHWIVNCEYETLTHNALSADPINDPVKISWDTWATVEIVEEDKDGAPITNSANSPILPPITREKKYLVVTIVRNEAAYDPDTAENYIDHVNSASVTIAGKVLGARHGLCQKYSGETAERSGYDYYVVTYVIAYNPNEWTEQRLDAGLYYVSGGKRCRFKDGEGADVVDQQWLDGAGGQLSPTGTPVFLDYEIPHEVNFNALSLPATM